MPQSIEVLLVEDNPADVTLAKETLRESKIAVSMQVAGDGVEALRILRHDNGYEGKPRPDLILLDLNLPKKSGREVLGEIKADATLRRIPIVVLTSSAAEADVVKSYDLGANCYIRKPVDLEQFEEIVHAIEDFWFTIVRLPC